jgi:hypothetical protein
VGQLRLPTGAEAGFRLVSDDEHGQVFTMHLYGAGCRGWFLLNSRYARPGDDPGPHPLGKGQWRTFLGLVTGCRFWDLPERLPDWDEIVSGRAEIEGWSSFALAGRDGERYHHIQRALEFERGLASIFRFCTRLSSIVESRDAAQDASPDCDGR